MARSLAAGLRWSDRREDYRTEVLGLMKAQVTKNAVIVPTGAKGGFVLRRPPTDPAEIPNEVRTQYANYIRALLDLTDNLVDGKVVHPQGVRLHDGDDPYLVVAADRGTATFSDLANSIAAEYDFWLDDAFASGGSAGYDHKALGITARGAWESLKRHFLELGIDPLGEPFTVIGIGDMSGDVFGNGMLGSDQIKLIAAFDHRHIFFDPNPDPAKSFAERKRLFDLPRSSWDDFDRAVISRRWGSVPADTEKDRDVAAGAGRARGRAEGMDPEPTAAGDPTGAGRPLLEWRNRHLRQGDVGIARASGGPKQRPDPDRRQRAAGPGGDRRRQPRTHSGRPDRIRPGRGKINTDFIDNSGGVNCSDREVNLKILLNLASERKGLSRDERDQLVTAAAPEVVEKILYDNFQQAQMISQEEGAALRRIWAHEQLMILLEPKGFSIAPSRVCR